MPKKTRENATACLRLRLCISFAKSVESITWTTPTKRASPLHPCKRGLNHCVCLFMELGRLLSLFNRNEELERRMVCYPLWHFWVATSTTRLARISVGCDGTKALVVLCRQIGIQMWCCQQTVCDVWLQDEGYDRTTEVLSRVSQFGVVQWLGTDVPLQLHTFQSLVPSAIVEVEPVAATENALLELQNTILSALINTKLHG